MTLRRAILYAMISAMIVSAVALSQPRTFAINHANAAKIRNGMTMQEVEQILGAPAQDEASSVDDVFWPPVTHLICCEHRATWIGPEIAVAVGFRDNCVVFCVVGKTGSIQRIRLWLHL